MLPVRVGVWVKNMVSFRVGGNQTIAPEEICLRLGLGFGLGLVLGLGSMILEVLVMKFSNFEELITIETL